MKLKYKFPVDRPYLCVSSTFKYSGFEITEKGGWNVIWAKVSLEKLEKM